MSNIPTIPPKCDRTTFNKVAKKLNEFKSPYYFFINQSGSHFEVISGLTHEVVYGGSGSIGVDGTDFSKVIQIALDNASGPVVLGNLIATANTQIKYYPNQIIRGYGKQRTIIFYGGSSFLFVSNDPTHQTQDCEFSDFTIKFTVDNVGIGGFDLDSASFTEINRVRIVPITGTMKTNAVGVRLVDTNHQGCYWNEINNCDIRYLAIGVHIANNGIDTWSANNNTVWMGRIQGCAVGFLNELGNYNLLDHVDMENNTIACKLVDGYFCEVDCGDWESNTQDLSVADGKCLIVKHRRDLITWGDGVTGGSINYIGYSYGSDEGGRLQGFPTGACYTFLFENEGCLYSNVGTSYIDFSIYTHTKIDNTFYRPRECRLIVIGKGNETGAGKGVAIVYGASTILIEYTWDGDALQLIGETDWIPFTGGQDRVYRLQVKGSSDTEDITLYKVLLQFR
jgi:hypothetical protein